MSWIFYGYIIDESTTQPVLCQDAKVQVGSGLGYFRQNRVGLLQVEPGNVNKRLLNFLLAALLDADKSVD